MSELEKFIIAARDISLTGRTRRERKRLQRLAYDLEEIWAEYCTADVPHHPMPLDCFRSERA